MKIVSGPVLFRTWLEQGALRVKPPIVILAAAFFLLVTLIAIPGYFSHDELVWLDEIRLGNYWVLTHEPFFRPLGAVAISAVLRFPLQPFGAHVSSVFLQSLNCCLLYLLVNKFWPDRAIVAALLFAVMPGTAFAVGWVGALFDLLFVLFSLVSLGAAISFWRGGHWGLVFLSCIAFAAGLLCKEVAIIVPLAAAVIAGCDHARAEPRRLAVLSIGAVVVILIYALLWLPTLLRIGTGSVGGPEWLGDYAFGSISTVTKNVLALFGFPFTIRTTEIIGYEDQSLGLILESTVPHLLLVFLLWCRYGRAASFLYLMAYFLPLLPVLIISKHETQYIYASSIAISVALALVWAPRLVYAVPTIALVVILALHGLRIQRYMYITGACQTRVLLTTAAVLPFVKASSPLIAYGAANTPAAAVRALTDRTFYVDDRERRVVFSRRAEGASLNVSKDCDVTLIAHLQPPENNPH